MEKDLVTVIEGVEIGPAVPRLIRSRVLDGDLNFYVCWRIRRDFKGEREYISNLTLPGDTGIRATPVSGRNRDGRYNSGFRRGVSGLWLYQIIHQGFQQYKNGEFVGGEIAAMDAIRELYGKYKRNGS